jgi:hypothetical protein
MNGSLGPQVPMLQNKLHGLMNYQINIHFFFFLLALTMMQISLTNDEWNLVDCRHCKPHYKSEHCP